MILEKGQEVPFHLKQLMLNLHILFTYDIKNNLKLQIIEEKEASEIFHKHNKLVIRTDP